MPHLRQQLGIFGIGSAQGIDALGWMAMEHLRRTLLSEPAAACIRWQISRTPMDMLPHWEGLLRILLLDALPIAGAGEDLRWLTPEELETCGAVSSHGLGIGAAIELAAALELRPEVSILGLVVDPVTQPAPDAWLARHAQLLVETVREWLPDG